MISLVSCHAAFPFYTSNVIQILLQLNFLVWAIDRTKWCNDKWPQIDRVNHHPPSTISEQHRNAKLWPAMLAGPSALKCHSQTLWLTISWFMCVFACDVHVLCETSHLQKPSELLQRPWKALPKPSNPYKSQKLGHFAFWMALTICLTETWHWTGACAHHHADGGAGGGGGVTENPWLQWRA